MDDKGKPWWYFYRRATTTFILFWMDTGIVLQFGGVAFIVCSLLPLM
jgi:hypothetical protein